MKNIGPVRIKDISEKLGLSSSTVSRVLNNVRDVNAKGIAYISDKTITRVLETAEQMGYRPNTVARALALGKTMRIALWVPEISQRFFHELFYKFHDYLKTFEYEILLCEMSHQTESPTHSMGLFRTDVDAAIIYGGDLSPSKRWEHFDPQLPIVNMGVVEFKGPLDYVHIDAYPTIVQALEHLLKTNRKKIVLVTIEDIKHPADPRYRAYIDVLKKAGKTPEYLVIDTGIPRRNSSTKAICEYLKVNECPDAFFCVEDEIAMGICRGLIDSGFKIPEDVAIVGFNGIAETEIFNPRISTIAQPLDEILIYVSSG